MEIILALTAPSSPSASGCARRLQTGGSIWDLLRLQGGGGGEVGHLRTVKKAKAPLVLSLPTTTAGLSVFNPVPSQGANKDRRKHV